VRAGAGRHARAVQHEGKVAARAACAARRPSSAREARRVGTGLASARAVPTVARGRRLPPIVADALALVAAAVRAARRDSVAQRPLLDVDLNDRRAGRDLRHAHPICGDAKERGEVAREVLLVEEVLDAHFDAERPPRSRGRRTQPRRSCAPTRRRRSSRTGRRRSACASRSCTGCQRAGSAPGAARCAGSSGSPASARNTGGHAQVWSNSGVQHTQRLRGGSKSEFENQLACGLE
jgi:hypothetical protein